MMKDSNHPLIKRYLEANLSPCETINSVVHGVLVVAREDPFGLVDLYNAFARLSPSDFPSQLRFLWRLRSGLRRGSSVQEDRTT